MILGWALCLLLGANVTPPHPIDIVPTALRTLLQKQPEALFNHQGYLKQLARKPDLAESETAWWDASAQQSLRTLAAQFGEVLGTKPDAQAQFDAYYDALMNSPDIRQAVENLLRTELDQTRIHPTLARAFQFLRANPDLAMRFLDNPVRVRPLPEPLQDNYNEFVDNPEWRSSLHDALGDVLDKPAAYQTILPWWKQLEALSPPPGEKIPTLNTELYRHPQAFWLWQLRNINLARNKETRPWIRYWNRLINRDPVLAQQYGPFITRLLKDPEQLRQHLADLQARQAEDAKPWPPKMKPPKLPPIDLASPVERMKRSIARPTIDRPERPQRPVMNRPKRPSLPEFPAFPSPEKQGETLRNARPVFPTLPTMPKREDGVQAAP